MTLLAAAQTGHMEIIEYLLPRKIYATYDSIMFYAANGGHIKIVKLMLEKGANNYNWAMNEASSGGHIDVVMLMLDLIRENNIIVDYDDAIIEATRYYHIEIVKLLLTKGVTDPQTILKTINKFCNSEIVNLIKNHINEM